MHTSGVLFDYEFQLSLVRKVRVVDVPHNINLLKPKLAPKARLAKPGWTRSLGTAFVAIALGGITGPLTPMIRLETAYWSRIAQEKVMAVVHPTIPLPPSVPTVFNPLTTPDGASIDPINTEFSLVVPKVGINAPIIPAVNPADPGEYTEALQKGVAHASTSYFPDENGTVYLFSHSTSYDWFVADLNAVFYHLKNLEVGDYIVILYKNVRYTYKLRDKKVVNPSEVSYLVPQPGNRNLILQTCWPPGSTSERLLIFADFVEEHSL